MSTRLKFILPVLALTFACTQQMPISPTGAVAGGGSQSQGGGSSPLAASVQFGQTDVGSPFAPGSGHDHSFNAKDNLVPRTVVIDVGGTVTYSTFGVHQVAIYKPGTQPSDINTSLVTGAGRGCPPVPLINDPNNRVAVLGAQPCAGGPTTPSYTFTQPGKYLVICDFSLHFIDAKMYGWVEVRARD